MLSRISSGDDFGRPFRTKLSIVSSLTSLRICVDQVRHNVGSRFPEGVGEDGIEPDFRDRHGILVPVLFGSPDIRQLQAVTAQFPEIPDIGRRDKGCYDKIHPEKAGDVYSVPEVGFAAFGLFDVLGMCQHGLQAILLKDVVDGDPVLAG